MSGAGQATYVVLEFRYNSTLFVSAAPKKWVKENTCWWPSKKDKERKFIKDAADPEKDWTLFKDIKILGHYTTYKEALYNEGKLAKTDFESDGEDSNSAKGVLQKRRKKPNRKYRDDSISPPPDLCDASSSSNKSDDNISLNNVDINSAEVIFAYPDSNDNYQERQSMNQLEQEKEIGNTVEKIDIVTSVTDITNILEAVLRLQETLNVINIRLTNIEQKLDCQIPQDLLGGSTLSELPLKAMQDLQEMEEKLKNADFKKKLFQVLRLVGGRNEKSCINRVLEKLFSNYVAMFCSWTGKKDNFKLKDLRLMEVVMSAVRANYPHISEDTFEKTTMSWFQFAKVRYSREKN